MEDTFIVVVNWNGGGLLPACLDALRAQVPPGAILVVDNGSSDDSAAVVAARPGVRWLPLGANTGFSPAANAGLRQALLAGARFVALVNTDVVLAPGWLAALRADADRHPRAGLWNGLLTFEDDPLTVNSTGLVFDRWLRARDRDFGRPLAALDRPAGTVPGVTLGAALLRASALRRTGLLDPAFFAYCEDADLSLRAARAGVGCRYVPAARARHGYARTSGAGSPLQRYLLARNHLRVAARHLPLAWAAAAVPGLALLRAAVAAPRAALRGGRAHGLAQLRAARDGLALGGEALRLRLAAAIRP
ncbi:MAG: glycosyltransferase family 2 protein [Anaeromyxobacter sp.]